MVVQLLHEVVGTAIVVLLYSLLCLAASSIMIWLVWAHHERDSYVALLSYFTLLGTIASIIQQFHTFIWWRDVKVEQYKYAVAHLGSPEIAIAGPSVGLDLVLFYIREYQSPEMMTKGDGRQSIYDRWLVLRFSIAFAVLGVFQLVTILLEVSQLSNHTMEKLGESANLSKERAKNDFLLFMPGVSTSLLVFVVFGTTRTFRKAIYKTFVPKRFQKKPTEAAPVTTIIPDEDVHANEEYGASFYDAKGQIQPDLGSNGATIAAADTSQPLASIDLARGCELR
ncbi:putative glycoside hydrolase protein [Daldinia childiae]|uniref:putative glycoside hydrolase protein n=1 Tax=Daldinia childiae TaxID=326645 RepID=UPI001446612E|nr:putative glycoside hydrolase protein [Daldinia childiae]KAF3070356.1 putative glycoside hydrolase protein [Daldinia childiae]